MTGTTTSYPGQLVRTGYKRFFSVSLTFSITRFSTFSIKTEFFNSHRIINIYPNHNVDRAQLACHHRSFVCPPILRE